MSCRDKQVLEARQAVCQALGDNYRIYLTNMKLWFRKIWTKEKFDAECRKLFGPNQRHLHNQFFLAILNKITAPVEQKGTTKLGDAPKTAEMNSSKKRKRTPSDSEDCKYIYDHKSKFTAPGTFDYLPNLGMDFISLLPSLPYMDMRYVKREFVLADRSLVMGRLLVCTWEHRMSTAADSASDYIISAADVSRAAPLISCTRHSDANPFTDAKLPFSVVVEKHFDGPDQDAQALSRRSWWQF